MATKSLYVGNLPYSVNESALKELFANYNPEAVRVIGDKGFGFVDVPDDMAQSAIEEMNGRELEGRAIVVNEARPRQERGRGERQGGFGRGGGGGGGRRGGGGGGGGRRW